MTLRATLFAMLIATPLAAQDNTRTRTPSHCIALAEAAPGIEYLHKASLPDVAEEAVLLHYIAHASFLIRSHGGLNIITDYVGFTGSLPLIPDVVTMNHAHESHFTSFPDPEIAHVLQGWGEEFGTGIDHNLDLGEVLIRNVPTDIRSAFSGTETKGNSIFVFEMAGLCIGHLGHLHHAPDAAQYAALGRLDVVMAPVDGGMTLDLPTMIAVLKRVKASIVIPMHWFSDVGLSYFLQGMEDEFQVVDVDGPALVVRADALPSRPTIMVLRPQYLNKAR